MNRLNEQEIEEKQIKGVTPKFTKFAIQKT